MIGRICWRIGKETWCRDIDFQGVDKISDRRLKKNIIPLFKIGDIQWYEFEYDSAKWPDGVVSPPPGKHVGVMADEVREIPGVVDSEAFQGFDLVNYDVLRRHLFMEYA